MKKGVLAQCDPLPNGAALRKSLGRRRVFGNEMGRGNGTAATVLAEQTRAGWGATSSGGRPVVIGSGCRLTR